MWPGGILLSFMLATMMFLHGFHNVPSIWDDPNRGKLPLMWCISPVLAERVPHIMHNFRTTATENDYFASADNGAGYIMPGMLQELVICPGFRPTEGMGQAL